MHFNSLECKKIGAPALRQVRQRGLFCILFSFALGADVFAGGHTYVFLEDLVEIGHVVKAEEFADGGHRHLTASQHIAGAVNLYGVDIVDGGYAHLLAEMLAEGGLAVAAHSGEGGDVVDLRVVGLDIGHTPLDGIPLTLLGQTGKELFHQTVHEGFQLHNATAAAIAFGDARKESTGLLTKIGGDADDVVTQGQRPSHMVGQNKVDEGAADVARKLRTVALALGQIEDVTREGASLMSVGIGVEDLTRLQKAKSVIGTSGIAVRGSIPVAPMLLHSNHRRYVQVDTRKMIGINGNHSTPPTIFLIIPRRAEKYNSEIRKCVLFCRFCVVNNK